MNRRDILKAVGTSSVGAVGLNSITHLSRASEEHSGPELIKLDGKRRQRALRNARQTSEVKELTRKYKKESWVPTYKEARGRLVKKDDGSSFKLVVIPFEKTENDSGSQDSQAIILWKSRGENGQTGPTVTGHQLLEDKGPDASVREITEVSHVWDDGRIVERSNRSEVRGKDEFTTDDNLPGGGGGGGDGCIYLDTYCVEFDLSCIATIVGALGLGCTVNLVSCLGAALLEGGKYYSGDACNVCDVYTTEAKTKPVCNCPSCH